MNKENPCCESNEQGQPTRDITVNDSNLKVRGTVTGVGITAEPGCRNETYEGEVEAPSNFCSPGYTFRDLQIKKLNYGYNVTAGCHTFAIETPERLIEVLTKYINDPNQTEADWWKTKQI